MGLAVQATIPAREGTDRYRLLSKRLIHLIQLEVFRVAVGKVDIETEVYTSHGMDPFLRPRLLLSIQEYRT